MRCRFGYETNVYADAPDIMQQFKGGYNFAAPADAVKGGLRRAPQSGGLNGVGARGRARGHRHASGGMARSVTATHGGSGLQLPLRRAGSPIVLDSVAATLTILS